MASAIDDCPVRVLVSLKRGWRSPPLTQDLGSYAQQAKFHPGGDLPPQDRWPSGRRRAPGERVNVISNDGNLSLEPHEMYEFPHNVFFAVVVEVAF